MPTILKREFAPISDQAWSQLDEEAEQLFREQLVARKIVDFDGPHGWELAAVNLGWVDIAGKKEANGVAWGLREVQPLIEARLAFTLGQMEIDNIARGRADVDLAPLQQAAQKLVGFEDGAVFNGFAAGGIDGLAKSSEHKPIKMPADVEKLPEAVSAAVQALSAADVGGPYALVLGTGTFFELKQCVGRGYPPRKIIEDLLEGPVLRSPSVTGGFVVSTRGGDFALTVGKDLSLGYASHDRENVEFFLTESFTFRVITPEAVVVLKKGS